MSFFEQNLRALKARWPELAARVTSPQLQQMVCVFKAQDGLPAYGVRQPDGRVQPITNPVNPREVINKELAQWNDKVADFTRPIFLAGFRPGAEVMYLFNNREHATGVHCDQPLWICVDSSLALYGFMQTYDATALFSSSRVELFWHEEMPQKVQWLREHPEYPYLFSLIALMPPQQQQALLAPLVQLAQERQQAVNRMTAENDAYYVSMTDEQLAQNLAGQSGRKPRLMVPTCPWSTVIQYSIRDTCRAFERAGWEVMVLKSPAMMTPYYVIESINQFKPDLFLYVNHLRQEVQGVVPDDLMLVTWVQDPIASINNHDAARIWNEQAAPRKRDLIVGYTGQLKPYGYLEERLAPLSMIVDTETFRPRELTPEQLEKYSCDVCFASNCGLPTERLVREVLVPLFEEHGLDEATLMDYHDRLWEYYRAGGTVISHEQLVEFLGLEARPEDTVVQHLFWRLNDVIYRHVVIEWLHEYAQEYPEFKLHLYGKGWDQHPRFARYAQGELAHGEELSLAYQAAKRCLHLNCLEGGHQRLWEIMSSGSLPLVRDSRGVGFSANSVRNKVHHIMAVRLQAIVQANPEAPLSFVEKETARRFASCVMAHPLHVTELRDGCVFDSHSRFAEALPAVSELSPARGYVAQGSERIVHNMCESVFGLLGADLPGFQSAAEDFDAQCVRLLWLMASGHSVSDVLACFNEQPGISEYLRTEVARYFLDKDSAELAADVLRSVDLTLLPLTMRGMYLAELVRMDMALAAERVIDILFDGGLSLRNMQLAGEMLPLFPSDMQAPILTRMVDDDRFLQEAPFIEEASRLADRLCPDVLQTVGRV